MKPLLRIGDPLRSASRFHAQISCDDAMGIHTGLAVVRDTVNSRFQ